jgi:hypothetical protein
VIDLLLECAVRAWRVVLSLTYLEVPLTAAGAELRSRSWTPIMMAA